MAKAGKAEALGTDRKAAAGDLDEDLTLIEYRAGQPRIQKARSDRLTKAARQQFLDHLAITCNVRLAAEETGFGSNAFYNRRKRDPAFRASWEQAMAVGVETLNMMLVSRAMGSQDYEPGEDFAPDPARMDPELAMRVVTLADKKAGGGTRKGAAAAKAVPVKPATEEEACAEIIKRLTVLRARMDAGEA